MAYAESMVSTVTSNGTTTSCPTKALSYAAEMKDNFEKARALGYRVANSGLDTAALGKWKDGVVKRLRSGIGYLLKNNGVATKAGRARIRNEQTVEIEKDGATESVEAKAIVIATGTEITTLPGFDFDRRYVISTDEAVELGEIPDRLLVIGAGASGLEMATIYHRLGSKVTIVEIMDQVLPGSDRELCVLLHKILTRSEVAIHLGSQVKKYAVNNGHVDATIDSGGKEITAAFDKILVTVGRRPMDFVFRNAGLKTGKNGYLLTDDRFQTNIVNIFAIGDIAGPPLLAHKATRQGIGCAEIISGLVARFKPRPVPACVFTIPPLSTVGLTEDEARAQGVKIKIGRFPYRASGRAAAMAETEGLIKIIGDENDRLRGIHILGAESPSLIGGGILEVEMGVPIASLSEVIYPHPTLTEIIGEAAENYFKKAIHIVND